MFYESGASVCDFSRVADLTKSQVHTSLVYAPSTSVYSASSPSLEHDDNDGDVRKEKSFFDLVREFEEAKYEQVRDRQMKELEIEDDLMSKLPVRFVTPRLCGKSCLTEIHHAEIFEIDSIASPLLSFDPSVSIACFSAAGLPSFRRTS